MNPWYLIQYLYVMFMSLPDSTLFTIDINLMSWCHLAVLQLSCCGFSGITEYGTDIPDSCYEDKDVPLTLHTVWNFVAVPNIVWWRISFMHWSAVWFVKILGYNAQPPFSSRYLRSLSYRIFSRWSSIIQGLGKLLHAEFNLIVSFLTFVFS